MHELAFKVFSDQHSLTSFTAEAGRTYYFRVQIHVESQGENSNIGIDLQPVNADEGKYLVATSPLSVSQP